MNPYLKSIKRAPCQSLLYSPSTSIDANGEGFSANNLQSTKVIFLMRGRGWSSSVIESDEGSEFNLQDASDQAGKLKLEL